ncbi:ABC-type antimicrobial peptide transport system permease subunit [Chitinophaga terrae (ex Kim and Jung 2007)]|uniref:ABC transporter permease n=1 Tax=Chitinophaga terrae (ex Kim and Jung 2007) TaxID=408074 RepID=UPI002788637F|nr:ABC transporter permease [Chitinophaga terrae (ex Kim and Jung 2007)]MDQ0107371.1 ABC-type antimicrobial peptide transport system permease subunit [Chitinophaga terrae (ex Kim and Jung 2007)]
MIKHALLLIYRGLKKSKTVFLINLVGLSTGLAAALLILLWVNDERSVNRFHEHDANLYQVMVNRVQENHVNTEEGASGVLGETLKREFPEVEAAATISPESWFQKFNISYKENTIGAKGNFASRDFFSVFSFRLLSGNKDQVLRDKTGIVLSETLARKLFKTPENAIGKTIEWKWASLSKASLVTGVYEDMPHNSTQQYDFVLPLDAWKEIMPATNDLAGGPFKNFVVLKPGADAASFNNKIANFISSRFKAINNTLFLRKYSDAYLYGRFENGKQAGGRIEYVKLFIIIAVFILLIACINFMNLSTARASKRMKEVGVKKALGIKPSALVMQFLSESLVLSFLSLLIAVSLIFLLLPQFNNLTGKHLTLSLSPTLMLSFIGIALVTGLIAGSYPAFYLSRFKPVITLKGKFTDSASELFIRKGSVVFQFVISVIFVSSLLVVYNQVKYVQSKNLGYNKDNILYFEFDGKTAEKKETFLEAVKRVPGVINASSIQQSVILPGDIPNSFIQLDGNTNQRLGVTELPVNYGLIETLDIKIADGRSFSRSFASDSGGVILNEAAVKAMNLSGSVVGKTINVNGANTHVVGVTRNFHFNSMHSEIKPFVFRLSPDETMLAMIRLDAGRTAATIKSIEETYKAFNPGYYFDYKFLDSDYQQQYQSEMLVAGLSRYFAALAILISCLGLFGLAAFTVERRAKEIGMRKIMGAQASNIVYLLSADFTKIVLIAIAIAIPVSYLVTRHWLNGFAYRISLSPLYFIGAALTALCIAWLTIGLQTIRASRINPLVFLKDNN